MTISPWWLLASTLPVLLVGEMLVRNIRALSRFDIPASVVGGLLIALVTLTLNALGVLSVEWATKVNASWWTWIVYAEPEWTARPSADVFILFSTAFFTCVGLNASWRVVRTGSWQLLLFLGIATSVAVLQNVLGVMMARGMGQHPALGLLCGGVTLTGGMNTAFANDDLFKTIGFNDGRVVGAAATMFGIITASLLAGVVGGGLIRYRGLASAGPAAPPVESAAVEPSATPPVATRAKRGFFDHLATLGRRPLETLLLLLVLFACVKAGAWLGYGIRNLDIVERTRFGFPVYMPGLLLAIVVRNLLDAINPSLISTEAVERLAGVFLGLFLVAAIASLPLMALAGIAGPMLVILAAQVVLMIGLAATLTFWLMGRDYHAAVISTGHIGFGLGMTANAVATMDVLAAKFGSSPRSFLIVTLVGAFLIDIVNSFIIMGSVRLLQ